MPEESKVVDTESDSSRNEISPRDFWGGGGFVGCLIGVVIALALGVDWVKGAVLAIVGTGIGSAIGSGGKARANFFRGTRRALFGGVIGGLVGAAAGVVLDSKEAMTFYAVVGAVLCGGIGVSSVIWERNGFWRETLLGGVIGCLVGVIAGAVLVGAVDAAARGAVIGAAVGADIGSLPSGWRILKIIGFLR